MKRFLAFLMCILMVVPLMFSCANNDEEAEEDKGTTIPVYISSEIYNFDPAYAYTNEASVKILGLIYQGMFRINESGKRENALCKSYKIIEDESDGLYKIQFKLKDTKWSDGRAVQADDFVYAFKRIMEPEFMGEAVSMLFDIKNARAVKSGDASIDDLGVYAVDLTVLEIEFETRIDYEQFCDYLASPLLVPLREDAVNKATDWSSNTSILVCNGPFVVRTFDPGNKLVLERNIYYMRDVEEDKLTKYVVPYRLVMNFSKDAAENLVDFENVRIAYDAEISLASRSDYADKAETQDMQTVLSYVFNTKVAPFDNAKVRQALSLALDRTKIAEIMVYAAPAAGLITNGVYNTTIKAKTTFRSVGGDLVSASADLTKAKSLLSEAGVSGGSFEITIRNNEVDRAVAEYAVSVWEQLGFSVSIRELDFSEYEENEYDLVTDEFAEAYAASDFDVISIDYQMFSTDAFPNLAQFAYAFAGGKMDLASGNFDYVPHVSGYASEEYNTLIESAFAEKDRTKRAEILHQAEALLISDAPIAPLAVYKNAYVLNSDLSKRSLSREFWGYTNFAKANLSNEENYTVETTQEGTAASENAG